MSSTQQPLSKSYQCVIGEFLQKYLEAPSYYDSLKIFDTITFLAKRRDELKEMEALAAVAKHHDEDLLNHEKEEEDLVGCKLAPPPVEKKKGRLNLWWLPIEIKKKIIKKTIIAKNRRVNQIYKEGSQYVTYGTNGWKDYLKRRTEAVDDCQRTAEYLLGSEREANGWIGKHLFD